MNTGGGSVFHRQRWVIFRATLTGTPKLLATDGRLLYFTHPESIAPNKWIVARDERS
jgi:hypothetical protein